MSGALELGWGALVAASLVYGYDLLSRKGGGAIAARALLASAWALVGLALAAKWRASGLHVPPWLSLAETLVFGAWMLSGVALLADMWFGAKVAGFFCASLAASVIGTVLFKLGGLGPVLPAYEAWQRPWIWLHVPFGAAGYALCLVCAFASIARLVRAGVAASWFRLGLAAVTGASLLPLLPGIVSLAKSPGPTELGTQLDVLTAIAGYAAVTALSLLGFWLESLDRRLARERELHAGPDAKGSKSAKSAAKLLPPRRGQWRWLGWLFVLCWVALVAVLARMDGTHRPYLFAWLVFLAAIGLGSLPLSSRRKAIEERLPGPEALDRISHRAALFAFPCLTVSFVAGSLWSYDVWASYWSWGAQQGWALAAWIYLAWLLHLKQGRRSTALAGAGLVIWVMVAIAAGARHGFWPAGIH